MKKDSFLAATLCIVVCVLFSNKPLFETTTMAYAVFWVWDKLLDSFGG